MVTDEQAKRGLAALFNVMEGLAPDHEWGRSLVDAYAAAEKHEGDCTKTASACFVCEREHWFPMMRAALDAVLPYAIERARREALEEAAKVAKGVWLELSRNRIGDADIECALCELAAARIRALASQPFGPPEGEAQWLRSRSR